MHVRYFYIRPSVSGNSRFEAVLRTSSTGEDSLFLDDASNHGHSEDAESFNLDEIDLGEDLPWWAEDIRGQIHNRPENVVAVRARYGLDNLFIVYYYGWDPV